MSRFRLVVDFDDALSETELMIQYAASLAVKELNDIPGVTVENAELTDRDAPVPDYDPTVSYLWPACDSDQILS